jgi:hypothetical protein
MKEITRRLYTKPVMLGMAFLVGAALVVGLFITTKSNAASTFVPAGDDKFETTGNGETYHNFGAAPIPANFFGSTSEAYTGVVPLVGVPLPGEGDIDTIIHRNNDVVTPGTTGLKMTALNLMSINPITVSYSDPTKPDEAWTMQVNLSTLKASTGTMTIHSGGTFDSTLSVFPKFTFRRVSDGATKVLDTGASTSPFTAAHSATAIQDDIAFEPAPNPIPAPAPCNVATIDDVSQVQSKVGSDSTTLAAATRSCAPVRLTSTNSPWGLCPGFCIPRPITEAELWASHNASPPGTKKVISAKAGGAAAE